MDDNLIPVLGIICLFGLPMIGWILGRVMKHRERMEMLRMGMVPPPDGRGWGRRDRFAAGPGMPPPWMSGAGPMSNAPGPQFGYAGYEDPNSAQCTLRRGIVTAMVGFAILIGLSFIGYRGGDGPFVPASIHPGPWLLGGLIPMFVGIAQIIIALMSGAAFASPIQPPPGSPGPPPPGPRTYGSGQSSPPGPRYEELARPVPPPDRT
jgi:hypothetical protein